MVKTEWLRVSRSEPCPICKHPDWCLIDKERTAVICPRVESPKRCGEAGWLHKLTDSPQQYTLRTRDLEKATPARDMSKLNAIYEGAVENWRLHHHAAQLGLSARSLVGIGIGYAKGHNAWSFPMRDGDGKVIGIRLRKEDGEKYAVRGSKNGIFIPACGIMKRRMLFIVEGPTDLAAMMHLGFEDTIGRPFNRGGTPHILKFIKAAEPVEVVIIADADGPGMVGAMELCDRLPHRVLREIIRPPGGHKDVRKFVQAGGTRDAMWRHISDETEA